MCIPMPQTIKEDRLRWVVPIVRKEIKLADAAKLFPHGKRTLERWVATYRKQGEAGLEPRSTARRTQENETPIRIKEYIIELRKKTKKCALKLHWQMKKEGLSIPPRTIGGILKREGLVRRYRVRKLKTKYVRIPLAPGELVEIDVKYVPGTIENKAYFQYTAIDCTSRWRYLAAYDEQSSEYSIDFLKEVIERFEHRIRAIKTDNGSIFTNYYAGTNKRSDQTVKTIHALDIFCASRGIIHYLIDPGKPAQNGKVERSHREDQEKFYEQNKFKSFADLRNKMKIWNTQYNNLEHCGLDGKTPNEFLADYTNTKPPYVPA